MPRIDDLTDSLQGNECFTSLSLASEYHQFTVDEKSIPKTAFITLDDHYEYLGMPFGLVNGPAAFQRAINSGLDRLKQV